MNREKTAVNPGKTGCSYSLEYKMILILPIIFCALY
jgi:hypothetical protein